MHKYAQIDIFGTEREVQETGKYTVPTPYERLREATKRENEVVRVSRTALLQILNEYQALMGDHV